MKRRKSEINKNKTYYETITILPSSNSFMNKINFNMIFRLCTFVVENYFT